VALVTSKPREARIYREAIFTELALAHLTVEVHECVHEETGSAIGAGQPDSLSVP
jgi:hypothetical protein